MPCTVHRLFLVIPALTLATPVCAQDWQLYQFRPHEHFRYQVSQVERGEKSTGYYTLNVTPADQGRLRIAVEGSLGDMECSASVTAESSQALPQLMMVHCMMIAPVTVALFAPTWAWFLGRSWAPGDHWSMRQGGESISFGIEGDCRYAGQRGVFGVMKQNGHVRLQSCVATDIGLPLAAMWKEPDGDGIEMTLIEYRR